MTKIKVFLVDDHLIVREGLRRLLDESIYTSCVGEADRSDFNMELLSKTETDVVILDINLPPKGGLDTLSRIGSAYPKVAVLVLSVHDETLYAIRAMRAGAAGYLTKNCGPAVLIEAIMRVHEGGRFISETLGEKLGLHADLAKDHELYQDLSDREFQLFLMFAQGLKPAEISKRLHISTKTIDAHRRKVMDKLHIQTVAELVRYAMDIGLLK